MFNILKDRDRIRKAESENKALKAKNQQLEDALLELAQIVGGQYGETVPTEDK
ncbi:MAG TPA: hypothetical protein VJ869_00875 [Sphaerochaeta sp.]|nr:hypothetical protein [Sphaerochaeta sp.]